jgi:hypothetical protein
MEEAGSGHEDSNILTLDALQVLSRSQVTLGLSIMRIRRICKDLHTYILYGRHTSHTCPCLTYQRVYETVVRGQALKIVMCSAQCRSK